MKITNENYRLLTRAARIARIRICGNFVPCDPSRARKQAVPFVQVPLVWVPLARVPLVQPISYPQPHL